MNISLTGSFAPLKRGLIWKVSSKKVPCESIKSIFIADKRCHDYLYTCSTFMCFFITLLAVTILNHNGAMSQTSFDHNLKRDTLVKVDINVKFTRLVSCWVKCGMKTTVILPDCVISPYNMLCRDFDYFTTQITSCHGFHSMVRISLLEAKGLNSLNCSTLFGHKTAMPLLILGPLEGTWWPNPLLFRQKVLTRRRMGDTGGSKESPGCRVIW